MSSMWKELLSWPYTPFPPPQQPSAIDIQLETGEYFLNDKKKQAQKWREKQEKQAEKATENKRKREASFVPPKEPTKSSAGKSEDNGDELNAMTASLKEKTKEFGKQKRAENVNAEEYIAAYSDLPSKKKPKRS